MDFFRITSKIRDVKRLIGLVVQPERFPYTHKTQTENLEGYW